MIDLPVSAASLSRPYEYRGLALGNLGLSNTADTPHAEWQALLPAAAASALRSAVWAGTGAEAEGRDLEGVHVTRVMNLASRLLRPLKPDSAGDSFIRDLCRDALSDLGRLGDLVRIAGGRWLPAPLRAVQLRASNEWMLIGGLPSSRLRIAIPDLRHVGFVRVSDAPPSGMYRQSLGEWLDKPTPGLSDWLDRLIASANWLPFDSPDADFEVYVPRKGDFQTQRWQDFTRRAPNGIALIRRRRASPEGTFLLARFNRGRLTDTFSLSSAVDSRRVCYAFDARSALPTQARFDMLDEASLLITLRDSLPTPEFRLFTALAIVMPNEDGHLYPRRWRVRREHALELIEALRGLGIDLVVSAEASRIATRALREYGIAD